MKNQLESEAKGLALITGASTGIGRELAREFARNGHPLLLVASDMEELKATAEQIRGESAVTVDIESVDLRVAGEIAEFISGLTERGVDVEYLCNNAGIGIRGNFWEVEEDGLIAMVRLNVEAIVRMTRAILPRMVERGHGRILNTASVAGYQPAATMGVYHATKAFVLSLSEATATELKETGVTLTALCPGPVDTDFFTRADIVEATAFQKGNLMAPQEVAEAAYKGLMSGEREVIPGGINKALVFGRRLTTEEVQTKINRKQYEDVKPEDHKREPGEVAAKAEAKKRKKR